MHGPMEKDEFYLHHATFPFLYVMRWMSCFIEHVLPRNRLIARAFSRVI